MNILKSTYRIQFHKEFNFKTFREIIPFLADMGIGAIYASPIFRSVQGSTHGYDGVNPNEIGPEIGTMEELVEISQELKSRGIDWLQDIVPNHQGFSLENPWLMDVLEKGRESHYATYFDIDWDHPQADGKLLWPVLDKPLEELLEQEMVSVIYQDQRLYFCYAGQLFPLNPQSYITFLDALSLRANQAYDLLLTQLTNSLGLDDPLQFAPQWDEIRAQLEALFRSDWENGLFEDRMVEMNQEGVVGALIQDQAYKLLPWWQASKEMNYRRFFTVNDLICLNIQNNDIFDEYHQQVEKLLRDEVISGLRIDHVDGLYNPVEYLRRLRKLMGRDKYLVVEKILEREEALHPDWPVEGTTGYDFLALVNNLFTKLDREQDFTDFYQKYIGAEEKPRLLQLQQKRMILREHMAGEWENLFSLLSSLSLLPPTFSKENHPLLKDALGEMMVFCPVYRFYGGKFPLEAEENCWIHDILDQIRSAFPHLNVGVEALEQILIIKPKEGDLEYNERLSKFYARCMQYTGPLMAKGVEDTLMYVYNRFIAHNEVGDSVEAFGITVHDFHQKMILRQERTPLALSGTATHDTKRGEDVRARLNVLSDFSQEWFEIVGEWSQLNAASVESGNGPDRNDAYFVYQTLVGSYPLVDTDVEGYSGRLKGYLQKALRESKRHTQWGSPNLEYEHAVDALVDRALDKDGQFHHLLVPFVEKIADYGMVNSLAQLILKFACPGIPDVYQGTELWDLSFVDPDNRRPVDYRKRQAMLEPFLSVEGNTTNLHELWEKRRTGQVKLWLTHQLMLLRQDADQLLTQGSYIPLTVSGAFSDHIMAFARVYKNRYVVVIVPLHLSGPCDEQGCSISNLDWKNTCVQFPDTQQVRWTNLFQVTDYEGTDGFLVNEVFDSLPFAILQGERLEKGRDAGILMHITSLAAPFGIGDLGPEAYGFVDFLSRGNQSIWQLLPLNPTAGMEQHSPYSTLSSQAGNMLLISPALLYREGLLEHVNLKSFYLPNDGKVRFESVLEVKKNLLSQAYSAFNKKALAAQEQAFNAFCVKNQTWLDDYACFMVIRDLQEGKPWYEWEDSFRRYDPRVLSEVSVAHKDDIRFQKWIQFIFDRQWKALQKYAHSHQVRLLGDIPFYVSYNSVDVWAHQSLFKVDADGDMVGVAGVPPDAFSDDGQLWGMPTYDWGNMRAQQYDWWIRRLKKNKELFDFLRFDHFRAFVDYWEVPGSSTTAKNGVWKHGPGTDFFDVVKSELNGLPFVAEDLGASNPEVYRIRDLYALPGMKVLQFAFDENFAQNPHIPHQYSSGFLAYTGTHDNNTTLGWYHEVENEEVAGRIAAYVGHEIDQDNIVEVCIRLIYASVAQSAILPIQDVLSLGSEAKMNRPGSTEGNWTWRLMPGQLTTAEEGNLRLWTKMYNRA